MPTVTYYQSLAEEILGDLDAVAAKMPKLTLAELETDDFVRAHVNVPIRFIGTSIFVVEQTDELAGTKRLDPDEGRAVLQMLEAFQTVLDRLSAMGNELKSTMKTRKARMAWRSLQVYAIARGLVRKGGNPELETYVASMGRDLGPRGRPRKRKADAPPAGE